MTNHDHTPDTRRILVVANEIVEVMALHGATGLPLGNEQRAEVRVIAPALNSRLRHWLSDEDGARASAGLRLAGSLERLCAAGIVADGQVGDADPLRAIADALFEFRAEEIVIATSPGWRAHWATRDLVERVQRRFAQPVVHVLIEPGADAQVEPASSTRRRVRGVRRAASAAFSIASVHPTGSLVRERIEANG
jgi:GABA permease